MSSHGRSYGGIRGRLTQEQMTNYGDVYDTPPTWIRVLLGLACLVGGIVALVHLIGAGMVVAIIITAAALILALYLLSSLETAAQVALVTIGFWLYLGILVLYLP